MKQFLPAGNEPLPTAEECPELWMSRMIPFACALTVPDLIGLSMTTAARNISNTDIHENAFKHKLKSKNKLTLKSVRCIGLEKQ